MKLTIKKYLFAAQSVIQAHQAALFIMGAILVVAGLIGLLYVVDVEEMIYRLGKGWLSPSILGHTEIAFQWICMGAMALGGGFVLVGTPSGSTTTGYEVEGIMPAPELFGSDSTSDFDPMDFDDWLNPLYSYLPQNIYHEDDLPDAFLHED